MLVVFGSINIDMVFPVPRLPQAGDTLHADSGWNEVGGHGANQAIAAARDGATVRMVAAVATDAVAETALRGLGRAGVLTRGVERLPGHTGRSSVCVQPDGHTIVVTDRGANRQARADQVKDRWLGPGRTLLLQMDTDADENARLVDRARRRGTRVVLNLSPRAPIATDALRAVDVLVGNGPDLAWLGEHLGTGNNPASLRSALGVTTVRMLGVQGSEAAWEEGYVRVPAMPVSMRDTTAAADCFVGVLAAALDRRAPLPDALRRATVAAALSVEHVGTGRTMPRKRDIDAAMPHAPEASTRQPEVLD